MFIAKYDTFFTCFANNTIGGFMEENVIKLKTKLDYIKGNYIELPSNKFVNVGLLFEKLLGIENNSFSVADIDGIELKVSKNNSLHPITLFSCTCDGPDFFELNRFVNKYGACDTTYKETKILYINLSCSEYTKWGKNLKMKLNIDYNKKKIYIVVAHVNGKLIERRAYWNFSTLEKMLERKIQIMCLCNYSIIYRNSLKLCKFNDYLFYKYLGFDKFIFLLESGLVQVSIKYGIYKKGPKKGMSYNHGTSFFIKKDVLNMLFENFGQKK